MDGKSRGGEVMTFSSSTTDTPGRQGPLMAVVTSNKTVGHGYSRESPQRLGGDESAS